MVSCGFAVDFRALLPRRVERQPDRELGAFAEFAFHGDVAAHHAAEVARDRESQAGAAELAGSGAVRLAERLEQLGELLGRHADTGVADAEHDPRAALGILAR